MIKTGDTTCTRVSGLELKDNMLTIIRSHLRSYAGWVLLITLHTVARYRLSWGASDNSNLGKIVGTDLAPYIDSGIAELIKCRMSEAMCIVFNGLSEATKWQVVCTFDEIFFSRDLERLISDALVGYKNAARLSKEPGRKVSNPTDRGSTQRMVIGLQEFISLKWWNNQKATLRRLQKIIAGPAIVCSEK